MGVDGLAFIRVIRGESRSGDSRCVLEAEHQVGDVSLDREVKAELVAVLVTGYPDELSVLAREAINEDAYALLRKPSTSRTCRRWCGRPQRNSDGDERLQYREHRR